MLVDYGDSTFQTQKYGCSFLAAHMTSASIMFACIADDPYILPMMVYKSENIYHERVEGGHL